MKQKETSPQGRTKEDIFSKVEELKEKLIDDFITLLKIPALSPENGGTGESEKAKLLKSILNHVGFDEIEVITAGDSVPRPNITAIKHGRNRAKRIWVLTHTDIVPVGNPELWETHPFQPEIRDGKIFARGSEDNGQELIASVYAVKALNQLGIKPEYDICLAFVADEETGSEKGMKHLVRKGIFRKDDLIVVPDAGNSEGNELEVAEKSILWLKITTKGKQCHGSDPDKGINSTTIGMKFALELQEKLKRRFPGKNPIFLPPGSTFEHTKKEENVPNINTIPGKDVLYMDCRVIPEYDLNEIMGIIEDFAKIAMKKSGAEIQVETVQREQAAPPSSKDAEIVRMLGKAVSQVYQNNPKPVGIGGGTCAAIMRREGYEAVVWGKMDDMGHTPNEYAKIHNIIGDTKVYALLFSGL